MKKIITLVITLMTIVTLSASAQVTCGTQDNGFAVPRVYEKPVFYGDFTPCKNQKNVVYTIANMNPGLPVKWTWCRGIVGQPPSTGFVPTEFRWNVDPNSGAIITDGLTTSNRTTGFIYTATNAVSVTYKTKNTYLGCYFKDSCGIWQEMYGATINLSCAPGNGGYYPIAYSSAIDTGKTILNARAIHAQIEMSFNFDSIVGKPGPYTNIDMYVKNTSATCNTNGAQWFSDGYYIKMRFSAMPSLPFICAYGYNLYYSDATAGPRTFRVIGQSSDGSAWQSLPFTIPTNVYSNNTFPVLPTP
jgi:hypothetical protein